MKCIFIALLSATLFISCSKNKEESSHLHQYAGDWDFAANYGSLYFFYINVKLKENGTGDVTSFMKDNNFEYPASSAQWSRFSNDSILLKFDIPAYPQENWEFRGLANNSNTEVTGNYFMINKVTKERLAIGTAVLKAD